MKVQNKSNKGSSLVELIISILLLGVIVGAILGIVKGTTNSASSYDRIQVTDTSVHYPEAVSFVVDEADVINANIEEEIVKVNDIITPEIAVVTVKTTKPLDDAQYAINLASKWGVGDAQRDDGVLFLIVTEDRKIRIEVGTGLEAKLTDAEAGRILDNTVVPYLKDGNWNDGIYEGFKEIVKEVEQ